MATNLTQSQIEQLAKLLEAERDEADALGDTAKHIEYTTAVDSLRHWLGEGGALPAAAGDYAHLLERANAAPATPRGESASAPTPGGNGSGGDSIDAISLLGSDEQAAGHLDTLPAAPEPVVEEEVGARELRHDLERARSELQRAIEGNTGDLNAARMRIDRLLAAHPSSIEVSALAGEATTAVNRAIEEARQRGDDLRERGEFDAARVQYAIIRQLDEGDKRAADALDEIDRATLARAGEEKYGSLGRGLRETRDIQVLERAVRDAEMLDDEGRLPPALGELLTTARARYDDKRRAHGEMTTFAHYGDLAARSKAVQNITGQMLASATTIWDANRNEWIATGRALDDAIAFYKEESEKLARRQLDIIQHRLPGHPESALNHLREVMATRPLEEGETGVHYVLHFHEDAVSRLLAPRVVELEKMVADLRRAQAKVDQANAKRETDDLGALALLLEAERIYPGMDDLPVMLATVRTAALTRLISQIENLHNRASIAIDAEAFDDAVTALDQAEAAPARWPETARPAELQALKTRSDELRQTIASNRRRRADFDRLNARIREDLLDPAKRGEAMALYNSVIAEPRYAPLVADLKELQVWVNQHQDTGEQLAELRRYIQAEQWQEAHDLAETIRKSGKAGEASDEVGTLLAQADQELEIAKAQAELADRRVVDARKRLATVYRAANAEGQKLLQERLKPELDLIRAAMDEKTMEPLFQQATTLALRPELEQQASALRLFRHVAGDAQQALEEGWPAYALSKYTAAARGEADNLRKVIRNNLIPSILEAAKRVREQKQAVDNDSLVTTASDNALLLRQVALLDTSEEKGAADDLVVFQGRRDALTKERIGDWAGAIALWSQLYREFPRHVAEDLRRARIEGAIRTADRQIADGHIDEAGATLRAALATPDIGEAWELYLKQADVLAAQGDFPAAFARARRVEDMPVLTGQREMADQAAVDKRHWLEREQTIVNTLDKANTELGNQRFKEALVALNAALQNTALANSRRLLALRAEVFRRGNEFLTSAYETALDEASQESTTVAVVRLAELDELEKLAGIPEGQGKAAAQLAPLKTELEPSIRATIQQAEQFEPTADTLARSIEKAADLSKRLKIFRDVAPVLGVELGPRAKDLEREGPRISNIVSQLHRLRDQLRSVDDSDPGAAEARKLWENAIISGNFEPLETVRRQIRTRELDNSPDAIAFQERLDEWEEIRETIAGWIADIVVAFVSGMDFPIREGERPEKAENFELALILLRQIRQMPAKRKDGRSPWRQLGQADYARIVELMGPQLVIPDVYEEKELRGWAHVEEAAQRRLPEVNAWIQWDRAYTQHMDRATARILDARSLPDDAPLMQRKQAWEIVDQAFADAEGALASPVLLEGDPVAVRTRWADLVSKRADAARQAAADWRAHVKTQLPGDALLNFPTVAEFDAAAKVGPTALEAKLAAADRIGPASREEADRLAHYRNGVLPTLINKEKQSSLLRRLLRK